MNDRRIRFGVVVSCLAAAAARAAPVPSPGGPVSVTLPDFGAEVRAFRDPEREPVVWWPHVVNAAWGGGRGGPERRGGWLDRNWTLVDYLDRSGDYTTHRYLANRGIWYEVYGSNEYQETIHFREDGARRLLWDNGIARDMDGRRVLSQHYNTSVPSWAKRVGWDAFIVCNNAPRWSAVIDYDWLASPLLGFAISQDNIGGPTSRIGPGSHGRYCDYCNAKFHHHLRLTGRLPEFRRRYTHVRDYVRQQLADQLAQLPPRTKRRFDAAESARIMELCASPVMAEYQKFLYLSHLHAFGRYYRDAKLVARRRGRPYDVHGNQGGGFVGPNPYQIVLKDFVDTVWFETSGMSAYDMFKHGWNNAWGSFRYAMGHAMTGGRKPFMSMTKFHKLTRDMVEHEMGEACAGGGVLFVQQAHFAEAPQLEALLTDFFRFRHEHRALFASAECVRHARIALLYSIPTMMYANYMYAADFPALNALSGMARALEEGHLPFDVVILNHPELHADSVDAAALSRYRLLILPALQCLSAQQVEMVTAYLRGGGTAGLLGENGTRDEDNRSRQDPAVVRWREAGRAVDLMPGRAFLPNRRKEDAETREVTEAAIAGVRAALPDGCLVRGDLPRLLWVKTWRHQDACVSLHCLNYDIDFETGAARPTAPVGLSLVLPDGLPAEEAVWLRPGHPPMPLAFSPGEGVVRVELPGVRVYGVLVVGRRGLAGRRSAVLQGEALLARATAATGGRWGGLAGEAAEVERRRASLRDGPASLADGQAYADSAGRLLRMAQEKLDRTYHEEAEAAGRAGDAVVAFDFGGQGTRGGWTAVGPDSVYSEDTGYGWLPATDTSAPTPEETAYAMAAKYGQRSVEGIVEQSLLFWPYAQPPPVPLRRHLSSGTPRTFRVDVPPGPYTVRVVTTNPSWTNRNFQVSGMVRSGGAVVLADAVHDRGAIVSREACVESRDGGIELQLGGPTGWGVLALIVCAGGGFAADPLEIGGVRRWALSPRYANPDWYPISWVSAPPEGAPAGAAGPGWRVAEAPLRGLPVVSLGTNREADVGDVVYALAEVTAEEAGPRRLHLGASSQVQLWLNGRYVGYLPNEKGMRRDEWVVPVDLQAGRNRFLLKLQRFWERHWMFYASLTDEP